MEINNNKYLYISTWRLNIEINWGKESILFFMNIFFQWQTVSNEWFFFAWSMFHKPWIVESWLQQREWIFASSAYQAQFICFVSILLQRNREGVLSACSPLDSSPILSWLNHAQQSWAFALYQANCMKTVPPRLLIVFTSVKMCADTLLSVFNVPLRQRNYYSIRLDYTSFD